MAEELEIVVEQDHIESLTKSNGINAISELIWNALDADASEIRINYTKNAINYFEKITIEDNGHGLTYAKSKEVFKKLGGSQKRDSHKSPNGRHFHGKEGKGRYKSFSLGDLVDFESIYIENSQAKKFSISIDRNNLKKPFLSELEELNDKESSMFKVTISNCNQKNCTETFAENSRKELEEKFASYYTSYPDFEIYINGKKLEFESLIKNSFEQDIKGEINENLFYNFKIKIVEWNFDNKTKKTYFCNEKGIPFKESSLGIRSSLPISMFIQSVYIEKLHRDNQLDLAEMDTFLEGIYAEAKKIARGYVRERLHQLSKKFIDDLKKEKLYPYLDEPQEEVERAKRQVFDILALNIHEYLPSFDDQDKNGKKLTLALVKEALENDTSSLKRLLFEVIELPDEKREELSELLEKTTLVEIIDTMKDVTDRLTLLHGLELLIYDPEHSKNVKERKHLHKILVNETWVFGDEYSYGADDITLKNVLKQYLKELGREDYEEIVDDADNTELNTIPDVCLWKQFNAGSYEKHVNLVIELKKPTVDAGNKELVQIQSYANKVSNDPRFPKEHTRWVFILLTRDIKDEISLQVNQSGKEFGHVLTSGNIEVYVHKWGTVINRAKSRYKYVKERLNLNFESNEDAVSLLRDKYKQYLPDNF